jgi:hypothetical protein
MQMNMAKETEMAQMNEEAANEIKDMGIDREAETLVTRTHDQDSTVMAEPAAAQPAGRRNPLKQVFERRWRRKNDINSLAGLIREHSRVIAAMHSGRLSLDKGDVLSRAYGRHHLMVTALEHNTLLMDIQAQLAALRGQPSGQFLIDEAKAKESGK